MTFSTSQPSRILVTGGAGFIGSHTVVALCEAGYEPVIIDNLSNSHAWIVERVEELTGQKIRFYQGDCREAETLREVFGQEHPIAGVIHFAAFKAVGESMEKPLVYYDNNVGSMITLLEEMRTCGVRDLVFSSSCTVYGQPEQLPVTEDSEVQEPYSPYGKTKVMCEQILRDVVRATGDLRGIALRYFNPIGAHPSARIGELPIGRPNNLVPYLTQAAAGVRDELTVYGDDYDTPDGSCIRDYIHVQDLARAHVRALDRMQDNQLEESHEVYNLGTGKGASVLEVIQAFEAATGVKVPYRVGGRREGDVPRIWADTTKANEVLGWKVEQSLEEALKHSWEWQEALRKEGSFSLG